MWSLVEIANAVRRTDNQEEKKGAEQALDENTTAK